MLARADFGIAKTFRSVRGHKAFVSTTLVTETSVTNTGAFLIWRTLVTNLCLGLLQLLAISVRGNMDRHTSVSLGTPAPYGQACANCARSKCKCIIRHAGGPCER
jgi:hypothetical protein